MKRKHLRFQKSKYNEPVYWVMGRGVGFLGDISWKSRWKQWVFEPLEDSFWSEDCLEAVVVFLHKLNREQPMGGPHAKKKVK